MNFDISVFLTWQFAVACVAIYAVVETVKRTVKKGAPSTFETAWFQGFVLTPLPLLVGAAVGCIPGFLGVNGTEIGARIIIGIAAGFLSGFIYGMIKRFLPKNKNPFDDENE
jgi:hypothetical protein